MLALQAQVDLLGVLGDITRLRLLHVLSLHELSVGELVQVTELGQSRVSNHLGRLREHNLVLDRKAGTSAYYRFNEAGMPESAGRLWRALRGEGPGDSLLVQDAERAERVVRARAGRWPESLAGEMEQHYSPGRTWDSLARAFLGLASAGDVLDIGAGDGTVAELLSPCARSITCLDISERLLSAAVRRLEGRPGLRYVRADMQKLPFEDAGFDQVLLLNTLSYADAPARALSEAVRVLRPGGRLVLVTLDRHPHLEVAAQYGHRQPGFERSWLKRRLRASGLSVRQCEITSRERRRPHFEVITCFAQKPESCP